MPSEDVVLVRGEKEAPDGVIGGGAESGGVVVEAAIEGRASVHELRPQHISARIVQPHALIRLVRSYH